MKRILFFVLTFIPLIGNAEYSYIDKNLSYTGYFSQYYLYTDHNNFYKSRDNRFKFREYGLHATLRLHQNIDLAGQVSSFSDDINLEYLFLDFSRGDTEKEYGLRLGKNKRIFGLYGATRLNSVMRKTVFLPQTMYFDSADSFTVAGIGGMLYYEKYFGDNTVTVEGDCGYPDMSNRQKKWIFSQLIAGQDLPSTSDLDDSNPMCSISSRLRFGNNLRFNLNYVPWPMLKWGYKAKENPQVPEFKLKEDSFFFGVEYLMDKFTFASEIQTGNIKVDFKPDVVPDPDVFVWGYYFLLGYDITQKWEAFTYFGEFSIKSTTDSFTTGNVRTSNTERTNLRDIAFGLRYNINDSWSVRGEYHHFDGLINLFLFGNDNDLAAAKEEWNLFTVGINFKF